MNEVSVSYLKGSFSSVLVRNSFELARRVVEFLSDLFGKLDYGEEIAYTETKAHRDSSTGSIVSKREQDCGRAEQEVERGKG